MRFQTTTLLLQRQDEKRRTADSFVVNKPSVRLSQSRSLGFLVWCGRTRHGTARHGAFARSRFALTVALRAQKLDLWASLTLRQPRSGVTDWSIALVLTDHWLVCGEIATNKNSHASQLIANNNEPSSNLSNKTFKDVLQKETAVNFLKGNAILPDLKKE